MYDNKMEVKFELHSEDGLITKEFTVDDIEAWTHIILKCADFLSAHYGYGVSERILFITDHPYGRESDYAISKNEYKMILQHRKREEAIDSLWDDEEDTQ
jgi:hypothetical protein